MELSNLQLVNENLTEFDYVCLYLERMNEDDLVKLEESIADQRLMNKLKESKKNKLQQELKNDRIKMRELLKEEKAILRKEMKDEILKTSHKELYDFDDEDDEKEEEIVAKTKKLSNSIKGKNNKQSKK